MQNAPGLSASRTAICLGRDVVEASRLDLDRDLLALSKRCSVNRLSPADELPSRKSIGVGEAPKNLLLGVLAVVRHPDDLVGDLVEVAEESQTGSSPELW